jgi:hypothetical protein
MERFASGKTLPGGEEEEEEDSSEGEEEEGSSEEDEPEEGTAEWYAREAVEATKKKRTKDVKEEKEVAEIESKEEQEQQKYIIEGAEPGDIEEPELFSAKEFKDINIGIAVKNLLNATSDFVKSYKAKHAADLSAIKPFLDRYREWKAEIRKTHLMMKATAASQALAEMASKKPEIEYDPSTMTTVEYANVTPLQLEAVIAPIVDTPGMQSLAGLFGSDYTVPAVIQAINEKKMSKHMWTLSTRDEILQAEQLAILAILGKARSLEERMLTYVAAYRNEAALDGLEFFGKCTSIDEKLEISCPKKIKILMQAGVRKIMGSSISDIANMVAQRRFDLASSAAVLACTLDMGLQDLAKGAEAALVPMKATRVANVEVMMDFLYPASKVYTGALSEMEWILQNPKIIANLQEKHQLNAPNCADMAEDAIERITQATATAVGLFFREIESRAQDYRNSAPQQIAPEAYQWIKGKGVRVTWEDLWGYFHSLIENVASASDEITKIHDARMTATSNIWQTTGALWWPMRRATSPRVMDARPEKEVSRALNKEFEATSGIKSAMLIATMADELIKLGDAFGIRVTGPPAAKERELVIKAGIESYKLRSEMAKKRSLAAIGEGAYPMFDTLTSAGLTMQSIPPSMLYETSYIASKMFEIDNASSLFRMIPRPARSIELATRKALKRRCPFRVRIEDALADFGDAIEKDIKWLAKHRATQNPMSFDVLVHYTISEYVKRDKDKKSMQHPIGTEPALGHAWVSKDGVFGFSPSLQEEENLHMKASCHLSTDAIMNHHNAWSARLGYRAEVVPSRAWFAENASDGMKHQEIPEILAKNLPNMSSWVMGAGKAPKPEKDSTIALLMFHRCCEMKELESEKIARVAELKLAHMQSFSTKEEMPAEWIDGILEDRSQAARCMSLLSYMGGRGAAGGAGASTCVVIYGIDNEQEKGSGNKVLCGIQALTLANITNLSGYSDKGKWIVALGSECITDAKEARQNLELLYGKIMESQAVSGDMACAVPILLASFTSHTISMMEDMFSRISKEEYVYLCRGVLNPFAEMILLAGLSPEHRREWRLIKEEVQENTETAKLIATVILTNAEMISAKSKTNAVDMLYRANTSPPYSWRRGGASSRSIEETMMMTIASTGNRALLREISSIIGNSQGPEKSEEVKRLIAKKTGMKKRFDNAAAAAAAAASAAGETKEKKASKKKLPVPTEEEMNAINIQIAQLKEHATSSEKNAKLVRKAMFALAKVPSGDVKSVCGRPMANDVFSPGVASVLDAAFANRQHEAAMELMNNGELRQEFIDNKFIHRAVAHLLTCGYLDDGELDALDELLYSNAALEAEEEEPEEGEEGGATTTTKKKPLPPQEEKSTGFLVTDVDIFYIIRNHACPLMWANLLRASTATFNRFKTVLFDWEEIFQGEYDRIHEKKQPGAKKKKKRGVSARPYKIRAGEKIEKPARDYPLLPSDEVSYFPIDRVMFSGACSVITANGGIRYDELPDFSKNIEQCGHLTIGIPREFCEIPMKAEPWTVDSLRRRWKHYDGRKAEIAARIKRAQQVWKDPAMISALETKIENHETRKTMVKMIIGSWNRRSLRPELNAKNVDLIKSYDDEDMQEFRSEVGKLIDMSWRFFSKDKLTNLLQANIYPDTLEILLKDFNVRAFLSVRDPMSDQLDAIRKYCQSPLIAIRDICKEMLDPEEFASYYEGYSEAVMRSNYWDFAVEADLMLGKDTDFVYEEEYLATVKKVEIPKMAEFASHLVIEAAGGGKFIDAEVAMKFVRLDPPLKRGQKVEAEKVLSQLMALGNFKVREEDRDRHMLIRRERDAEELKLRAVPKKMAEEEEAAKPKVATIDPVPSMVAFAMDVKSLGSLNSAVAAASLAKSASSDPNSACSAFGATVNNIMQEEKKAKKEKKEEKEKKKKKKEEEKKKKKGKHEHKHKHEGKKEKVKEKGRKKKEKGPAKEPDAADEPADQDFKDMAKKWTMEDIENFLPSEMKMGIIERKPQLKGSPRYEAEQMALSVDPDAFIPTRDQAVPLKIARLLNKNTLGLSPDEVSLMLQLMSKQHIDNQTRSGVRKREIATYQYIERVKKNLGVTGSIKGNNPELARAYVLAKDVIERANKSMGGTSSTTTTSTESSTKECFIGQPHHGRFGGPHHGRFGGPYHGRFGPYYGGVIPFAGGLCPRCGFRPATTWCWRCNTMYCLHCMGTHSHVY